MKNSQKVDMFEKRKENASREKQRRKNRNIIIGLILLFIVLGTVALNMERLSQEPLSGSFPKQNSYAPNKLSVFQPRLFYANGQSADQGTAFLLNYNGIVYAVTCTHFIDFNGPKVNKIELLNPQNGKVLFTLDSCLGKAKNLSDSITADFIFMPVNMESGELNNCNILTLQKRNSLGYDKVFLPLKSKTGTLNGRLEMADSDFVMYSYRGSHAFSSESGSPLIRTNTNFLGGILSRADGQNKTILSPPLKFFNAYLNSNRKLIKLNELY